MNKAFEKILERLEEEKELSYADFSRYVDEVSPCLDAEYDDFFHRGLERAYGLVKEVAKEYKSGWIPCRERLPEYGEVVMCSCTNGGITISCITHKGVTPSKSVRFGQHSVIAWQPLPEPFKERD